MKTKQEMIDDIRDKIGRKNLSFGCRFGDHQIVISYIVESTCGDDGKYHTYPYGTKTKEQIEDEGIIGHPVMIGDVMDRLDNLFGPQSMEWTMKQARKEKIILSGWQYKRLPLNDQSEQCIAFIHSLLPQDDK